jgi:hypothetical protein
MEASLSLEGSSSILAEASEEPANEGRVLDRAWDVHLHAGVFRRKIEGGHGVRRMYASSL